MTISLDSDGKALVKLAPPAELIKARDEKRAQLEAKAAKKAASAKAEQLKLLQRMEKGRIPPQEMFRPPNVPDEKYASWDDKGVPLTVSEGKDISKNQSKGLEKQWKDQQKLHNEFLAWQKNQDK